MKTRTPLGPQVAFWGLCLIALGWLAITILFETHMGWPASSIQWMKRLVGWAVEFWLMRTLILGAGVASGLSLQNKATRKRQTARTEVRALSLVRDD